MIDKEELQLLVSVCNLPVSLRPSGSRLTHETGAGAAGASAAYSLQKLTEYNIQAEIVVFEKSAHIGGRAKTIRGDGGQYDEIEVGAGSFSEDHVILNSLSRDVGLQPQDNGAALSGALGIWDGSTFRYTQKGGRPAWWNFARIAWKYGSAPATAQKLADRTMETMRTGFGSHRPYESVNDFVQRNGLNDSTTMSAEAYLQQHNISRPFTTDFIQAATRAKYAQDLSAVHGFAALTAMASVRERGMSISRGNWRSLDRMLKISNARRRLNTKVTSITRHDNGTFSLSWKATTPTAGDDDDQVHTELFDIVIIAAPFHQTNITISPPFERLPQPTKYMTQHITVFTTAHPLSPTSLGLPPKTTIPDTIWTTPAPKNITQQVPLPFIHLTRRDTYNLDGCVPYAEYTYRLATSESISNAAIEQLLDTSIDPFPHRPMRPYVFDDDVLPDGPIVFSDDEVPPDGPIRWIHREVWPYAYAVVEPRDGIDGRDDDDEGQVELAPNLYHTSGAEAVLGSSLEVSAFMGRNVAALVGERWRSGELTP